MLCLSAIKMEQDKVKRSIKDAAKKGQKDVCVVLAKEMVQSKRAISKLYATQAHMNSVMLGMKNQCGEFRSMAARSLWQSVRLSAVKLSLFFGSALSVRRDVFVFPSCSAPRRFTAEEHRGDESHAEPGQSAGDPVHHEGVIKRNDKS